MLPTLLTMFATCFGCGPNPPAPPEDPVCESAVEQIAPFTGEIYSNTSASVTFRIASCRTDYIFTGATGAFPNPGPVQTFSNVSRTITVGINPSSLSLNSTVVFRLTEAADPSNSAFFNLTRTEVEDFNPGITTGLLPFSDVSNGFVFITLNQLLLERYNRYSLNWSGIFNGIKARAWVGKSFDIMSGALGGALPIEVTLWNINHKFKNSRVTLDAPMIPPPGGSTAQPAGLVSESRELDTDFMFEYGESAVATANTTFVQLDGVALTGAVDFPKTNVNITN